MPTTDQKIPNNPLNGAELKAVCLTHVRDLMQLTEAYGFERAARAYRASLDAVTGLKSLVLQLGIACDMRDKDSLYLAAGDTGAHDSATHVRHHGSDIGKVNVH